MSQYLGPCKTGATTASDSYAPATLSGATDWTWVLHEWSTNNCTTGPQSEDADNTLGFNVASATTYANSTLTTQQTTFAASTPLTGTVAKTSGGANTTLAGTGTSFLTQLAIGDTIAVPHAGGTDFRRVTAIATNMSLTVNLAWSTSATGQTATKSRQVYVTVAGLEQGENDYSTTWVLPGGAPRALTRAAEATTEPIRLLQATCRTPHPPTSSTSRATAPTTGTGSRTTTRRTVRSSRPRTRAPGSSRSPGTARIPPRSTSSASTRLRRP